MEQLRNQVPDRVVRRDYRQGGEVSPHFAQDESILRSTVRGDAMKIQGVAFFSPTYRTWFFVSDSESLIYGWNPKVKLWCYVIEKPRDWSEHYVLNVSKGDRHRVTVDVRKLASGIRFFK